MREHVLDANALYRLLTNGQGAALVADVLKEAVRTQTNVFMSAIAWGEIYYTVARHAGISKADRLLEGILQKIQLVLIQVDTDAAVRAARLKAQYNIRYADAFTAELAGNQRVIVTADVDHFSRIPKVRLLKLPQHR